MDANNTVTTISLDTFNKSIYLALNNIVAVECNDNTREIILVKLDNMLIKYTFESFLEYKLAQSKISFAFEEKDRQVLKPKKVSSC